MVDLFNKAGVANSNNSSFQFWQQHNHHVELWSKDVILQKLNYIHNNPVRAGFVLQPEDWLWSSAGCYTSKGNLLAGMRLIDF